jgi:hypothetical protein
MSETLVFSSTEDGLTLEILNLKSWISGTEGFLKEDKNLDKVRTNSKKVELANLKRNLELAESKLKKIKDGNNKSKK